MKKITKIGEIVLSVTLALSLSSCSLISNIKDLIDGKDETEKHAEELNEKLNGNVNYTPYYQYDSQDIYLTLTSYIDSDNKEIFPNNSSWYEKTSNINLYNSSITSDSNENIYLYANYEQYYKNISISYY